MRALVVYESMFGNTAKVAREVAEGLSAHADVELRSVADAPVEPDESIDLVVVGGPTHAFSLSHPATRAEARRQGAGAAADGPGLREWLDGLHAGSHHPQVAAFDTRVTKVRRIPGSAARRATTVVRRLGYAVAERPESFFVEDVDGPLAEGELARARAWGDRIGTLVETCVSST